jgi:hypothetical protein
VIKVEKVKVIFRKTKDEEIIAFFPESVVNSGNIMSYMHIGQHGEASLRFYQSTKKATEMEYKKLLNELRNIYSDCELVVKQKLCYDDLTKKAWGWRDAQ